MKIAYKVRSSLHLPSFLPPPPPPCSDRRIAQVNPQIHFEVLVHKVDGDSYMSDDHKIGPLAALFVRTLCVCSHSRLADCQQDINQQITEELEDSKLNVHPSFHLTSIYDHSIFEAFSKTVQKLIPQFAFLENLLDILLAVRPPFSLLPSPDFSGIADSSP